MLVYEAENYKKKAEQKKVYEKMKSLCSNLTFQTINSVFDPMLPFWKRREGKHRIISRLINVKGFQVFCLLDVFERKQKEYGDFLWDIKQGRKTTVEAFLNRESIEDWLDAELERLGNKTDEDRSPLPAKYDAWFIPPNWSNDISMDDLVYYDSDAWVSAFKREDINRHWKEYHHILEKIDSAAKELTRKNIGKCIHLVRSGRYSVLYADMLLENESRTHLVRFLISPFIGEPNEREISNAISEIKMEEIKATRCDEQGGTFVTVSEVYAKRCYPYYILCDEDLWHDIQTDQTANLALSSEEDELLSNVSTIDGPNSSLPLFINGRAGSGKSTMLFYLFADYCYRKLSGELDGSPLFLTCNGRLLDVARKSVHKILTTHHRKNLNVPEQSIEPYFHTFQPFLLSLLDESERERFPEEKKIDFGRFRRLYLGIDLAPSEKPYALRMPQAKRWSPELCWYVIRTFIKGYSVYDYMDHEDYDNDLFSEDRTVDSETFKEVHGTIWNNWYSNLMKEHGMWDDQDLVRAVIHRGLPRGNFAVFCDESQDFTRIELRLIIWLSELMYYDFSTRSDRLTFPFVFAGDPLQTLNPTGFRWESLKSMFHTEVSAIIGPERSGQIRSNYRELNMNYRSTPEIVEFCNLVQLWRHNIFDIRSIEPQKAWQRGRFTDPSKFIIGRNIHEDGISRIATTGTIIIVPCDEGQELEFVRNDEMLSKIFKIKDGDRFSQTYNILSPTEAKGLEFERVIIYNFGHNCPPDVWDANSLEDSSRIKHEFFFNKLYVAVSRAKEGLFIIDTEKGNDILWHKASTASAIQGHVEAAKYPDKWKFNFQLTDVGTVKEMETSQEDRKSIAKEFMEKGIGLENPDHLKRAQQYFLSIGDEKSAKRCSAYSSKFSRNFFDAGQSFESLANYEEAQKCYWQGTEWIPLNRLFEQGRAKLDEYQKAVAAFMIQKRDSVATMQGFIGFLYEYCSTPRPGMNSQQWRSVFAEMIERMNLLKQDSLSTKEWREQGDNLKMVAENGYGGSNVKSLIAKCYYLGENYRDAIRIWDESGEKLSREYYISQAKSTDFPVSLEWYERAGEYPLILRQWEESGRRQNLLNQKNVGPVITALEKVGRIEEAHRLAIQYDLIGRVRSLYQTLVKDSGSLELIREYIEYMSRNGHWRELLLNFEQDVTTYIKKGNTEDRIRLQIVRDYAHSKADYTDETIDKVVDSVEPEMRSEKRRQMIETSELLEKFIDKALQYKEWNNIIRIDEVGAAWERTGRIIKTVQFYEKFFNFRNKEIKELARKRWLKTKFRQSERKGNEITDREIKRRKDEWNMPGADIESLSEFPELKTRIKKEEEPLVFTATDLLKANTNMSEIEAVLLVKLKDAAKEVTLINNWEKNFSFEHGLFFEDRLEEYEMAAKIYELFFDDTHEPDREFAQNHWILCMQKISDRFKSEKRHQKSKSILNLIEKQKQEWKPKTEVPVSEKLPVTPGHWVSLKLPVGCTMEVISETSSRYRVASYEVVVNSKSDIIKIENMDTSDVVKIDFRKSDVRGEGDFEPSKSKDGKQTFSWDRVVAGVVSFEPKPSLELVLGRSDMLMNLTKL